MSVRKRTWVNKAGSIGIAWVADVDMGDGTRYREQFERKHEAKAAEARVIRDRDLGINYLGFQRLSIRELAKAFEEHLLTDHIRTQGTNGRLESVIRNYVLNDRGGRGGPGASARYAVDSKFGIGELTIKQCTRGRVVRLMASLRNYAVSYNVRTEVLNAIRLMFDFAMNMDWIAANPADGMIERKMKHEFVPPVAIPDRKLIALLHLVSTGVQTLLLELSVTSAARIGELMAMRWKNFNFEENTVWIAESVDEFGIIGTTKTESGIRPVHLPKEMMDKLIAFRAALPPGTAGDDDFIFQRPNSTANHVRWTLYRSVIHPLMNEARKYQESHPDEFPPVPKSIRWNGMRHFGISVWLEMSLLPIVAQKMAGHKTFQSIESTYFHVQRTKEAEGKLSRGFRFAFGSDEVDEDSESDQNLSEDELLAAILANPEFRRRLEAKASALQLDEEGGGNVILAAE